MVGITVAIAVSIGSAAGVIAVIARQHAPADGWRRLLRDGVHDVRSKQLSLRAGLREDLRSAKSTAAGGLDDLFTVAEPVEWPAYTEVAGLRSALARARRLASGSRRSGS